MAGHFFTQFAESGCDDFRFVGNHEDQSPPFSAPQAFTDFTELVFAKELLDLRFERVFEETDPSQALGAVVADVFDEAVQFTTGNVGVAFDVDGFDLTAVVDDAAEDFEVRVLTSLS